MSSTFPNTILGSVPFSVKMNKRVAVNIEKNKNLNKIYRKNLNETSKYC